MAYIIGDIAVLPRVAKRTRVLSCMNELENKACKKEIYNSEAIQQKINRAAEIRSQLENEVKERENNLKKINFYG